MSRRPSSPARSTTSSVASSSSYLAPTRNSLAKMTPTVQTTLSSAARATASPLRGRIESPAVRGGSPSSMPSRGSVGRSTPQSPSRGGSPTRPQSINRSKIVGVTPPSSSRGGSPGRSHSPSSREGRMMALVKDFQQLNLRPWGRRIEGLEKQVTKTLFLEKKDTIFLEAAKSRNMSFMRNVESIMEEAVGEDSGIESGIVRHSYAAWTESNNLNHRIDALLGKQLASADATFKGAMNGPVDRSASGMSTRQSRGASPASEASRRPTSRTQSPSAMSATSALSDYTKRRSSPVRKPVALPQPQTLQEISPMPAKNAASPLSLVKSGRGSSPVRSGIQLATVHSQQRANIASSPSRLADRPGNGVGSPALRSSLAEGSSNRSGTPTRCAVNSTPTRGRAGAPRPAAVSGKQLTHNERRAMLEGIEGLSKRSSLTAADLTWAQSVFMRLYGPVDGPKQFNTWFDEQALRAVKSSP